jgi:hypothetical protein
MNSHNILHQEWEITSNLMYPIFDQNILFDASYTWFCHVYRYNPAILQPQNQHSSVTTDNINNSTFLDVILRIIKECIEYQPFSPTPDANLPLEEISIFDFFSI